MYDVAGGTLVGCSQLCMYKVPLWPTGGRTSRGHPQASSGRERAKGGLSLLQLHGLDHAELDHLGEGQHGLIGRETG